jgi:mono/diheme cytochrome c family protein
VAAQAPSGADAGEAAYAANCAACHQANGEGVAGAFPPLAGHAPDLALADRAYLPLVLLHGLQGPISVSGTAYNGVMPAWAQLSDAQLADVLNYVLSAWGNAERLPDGFEPYRPEELAALREPGLSAAEVHERRAALGLE